MTNKALYYNVSSKRQIYIIYINGKIIVYRLMNCQILKNAAGVLDIAMDFKGIKSKRRARKNYGDYKFKFNNVSNEVNSVEYAIGMKVK
jgi:hypothetical protein